MLKINFLLIISWTLLISCAARQSTGDKNPGDWGAVAMKVIKIHLDGNMRYGSGTIQIQKEPSQYSNKAILNWIAQIENSFDKETLTIHHFEIQKMDKVGKYKVIVVPEFKTEKHPNFEYRVLPKGMASGISLSPIFEDARSGTYYLTITEYNNSTIGYRFRISENDEVDIIEEYGLAEF